MKLPHIAELRLAHQQIGSSKFKTAKSLVEWMGALQAQDYAMAKWGIGVRLAGSTDKSVEAAIDKGDIIRTHVMRPTWHFVSPRDVRWMVELTGPRIKASMKARHKELGLSEALMTRGNAVIARALSGGEHLTREEILSHFTKAKIKIDEHRSIHFLMWAELSCIACSGVRKGNKNTYALMEQRVPATQPLKKEEALARLAQLYFRSHGPATVSDFAWWSGLVVGDARLALELVKSELHSETIEGQVYWFAGSKAVLAKTKKSAFLLPAFDEFTISYKDRSASLNIEHNKRSITVNGIFKPNIVVNGQVTGLWKRTNKKNSVLVESDFFHPHSAATKKLIQKAAKEFELFLEKKVDAVGMD